MAGDWIKFRKSLIKDGRVRIVSRSCHAPVTHVVGALVTLWSLADEYAEENGCLYGYTSDDINAEVGIESFCESLPDCWIDLSGEWVKLPEYQQHNGDTAKKRAQDQERQKRHRSVTKTSRNERDKSVTREEKNREDIKKNNKKKNATAFPDNFQPNENNNAFATKNNRDITDALERFRDNAHAKGLTYVDWHSAFGTWLRNAVKWSQSEKSAGSEQHLTASDLSRVALEDLPRAL